MTVTEDGAERQLLVQRLAHRQRDVACFGVAHKDDHRALFGHLHRLTGGLLHACRLDHNVRAFPLRQPQDGLHGVLLRGVHHSLRAQFFCLLQPRVHDVRHDNVPHAARVQRQHRDQPDAARAKHHRRLPRPGLRLVRRVEADGQRLDQRALHRADVLRQREAQRGLVRYILLKYAVHGRRGEEYHIRAQVIPARAAELTVSARFSRFKGHAVAGFDVCHVFPDLHDHAAALVAEHKRRFYNVISDCAGFVVVQIASAHADVLDFDKSFVVLRLRDRALLKRHLPDACHHSCFHGSFRLWPLPFLFYNYFYKTTLISWIITHWKAVVKRGSGRVELFVNSMA